MGNCNEKSKKNKMVEIRGSLLARNSVFNFIGQAVPLFVGVITIPFIIRGLGTDRFGLLSIAWVVLGYFTIFDLGLGRATIKYVAEALGKGQSEQVPHIVWMSVTVQAVLGFIGALVLAGITPLLVERILNIPFRLVNEARVTFYLLALSVPVVLISGSFRGVLEAFQRFDLVNVVKIPSSTLTFLLPFIGIFLDFNLTGIVASILVARFGALISFIIMNFRISPQLRRCSASFTYFPRLLAFGGWVTVTSIVGPILVYLDRFLIGSFLSMSAVAYYSAPYEAITRLLIVASSLTMTLFPAFSTLEGIMDRQRLSSLFVRSVKYIFLILGPVVLFIVLFSKEILQIWLGNDFATKSTLVLQILALGVLVNSLAQVPFALLQGVGRPDIPAKFHLVELPVYLGIGCIFVRYYGITGAATSWTLRVVLDALLLFGATLKFYRFSFRLLAAKGILLTFFAFIALAGTAWALKSFTASLSLIAQFLIFIMLINLFIWLSWKNIFDSTEREEVLKVVKLWKKSENVT